MFGIHPIQRIKNADKVDVGKWTFIGLAGIFTFIATLFDTKSKDRQYERRLGSEIEKQAKKLLAEQKTEG